MLVRQIRDIFNFPVNPDEVIDELIFMYENEISIKGNSSENNDAVSDKNTTCYNVLNNLEYLEKWRSVSNLNIDKLLKNLDKKLSKVEVKMNVDEDTDNTIKAVNDEIDSEQSDVFLKYCPQEKFSDYYKLFFVIALLYKTAVQIENEEYDENIVSNIVKKMISYRIGFKMGEEIVNQLAYFMIKPNDEKSELWRVEKFKELITNYIKNISKKVLDKEKFDTIDGKMLLLALQFYAFAQVISNYNTNKIEEFKNAVSTVALLYANTFRNRDDYDNGIKFAALALNSAMPEERLDAYNVLALCAIEGEQLQLAYDIYFSWINRFVLEDISELKIVHQEKVTEMNMKLQSKDEEKWRKENKKQVAIIYGNFSYVCGVMYDAIDESVKKKRLMFLAKYYILRAIELDPQSSSYYCSAGTISIDGNDIRNALMYYKKYRDLAHGPINKLSAMRSIMFSYRDAVLNSNFDKNITDEFEYETEAFINQFNSCANILDNKKLKRELMNSRDLYLLFSECKKISIDVREIKYILFQIDAQIYGILNDLRQVSLPNRQYEIHIEDFSKDVQTLLKEINSKTNRPIRKQKNRVNEIAYYTTLKNLEFLFLDKNDEKNNKQLNCLTMMHARYMNDPEEGLTLLKSLNEFLPDTPEVFRNKLYDQKFVFLKSFTGLIDQLNMWTMYGSDKTEGNDCNGCCICIAPETFELMIKSSEVEKENEAVPFNTYTNDDFHLYSVAYIDGENVITNGKRDLKLSRKYKYLKKTLEKLDVLLKKATNQDKEIICSCLVRMFEKVMFLFKDISYSFEGESRLIITRDINDREEIFKTEQVPPKLYINPMYQVYPEQIILGPKVDTPDYWIPHLQYELSKIRERWEVKEKRDFKPIVRISGINIR